MTPGASGSPPSGAPFYRKGQRAYYTLRVALGQTVPFASNIRFRYGELGEREVARAHFDRSEFFHQRFEMNVPETLEVWWTGPDQEAHHAVVPVRSLIRESLSRKSVLVRIQSDRVEAFIAIPTSAGERLEQFH
jgi:hypothetical protein